MIVYQARQVKNREDFQCQLDTLDRAYVAHYPWGGTFQPKTYACLAWDTQGLHLYMRSYEAPVREEASQDNGDIYMDSCMEFFFNPIPQERADMFINLEMNPRRYLYLACGTPDQRTLLTSERYSRFKLDIRDKGSWEGKEYWDVLASIPFAFIQEHAPGFAAGPGARMTGNFFKCGDETPYPHFGCWSDIDPIPGKEPSFYRPDCFGEIVLV